MTFSRCGMRRRSVVEGADRWTGRWGAGPLTGRKSYRLARAFGSRSANEKLYRGLGEWPAVAHGFEGARFGLDASAGVLRASYCS